MRGLLVGYGSIGRRHLANLHELGVEEWAAVHTGLGTLPLDPPCPVRLYTDLGVALQDWRPAFAVIANPTRAHVPAALDCVSAGCHLLLEKPVSDTWEGVEDLQRAALGSRVLVGFQFRFHPAILRIRRLLRSGALGAPLHADVAWSEHLPSWHPWEDWRRSYAARPELGGGVHHTICHPLDYLRFLFGHPSDLSASLFREGPLGLPVPEAAEATLCFPGGVSAHVHLDYWARPSAHRLQLTCTEGTVEWDYIAGYLRTWEAEKQGWQTETAPAADVRNELFVSEARHFLRVLAGEDEPGCTLADGIAALQICQAMEVSDASRGRFVPVSTLEPHAVTEGAGNDAGGASS